MGMAEYLWVQVGYKSTYKLVYQLVQVQVGLWTMLINMFSNDAICNSLFSS